MNEATDKAITQVRGKRSFVLSRSTFAGSGKYTAHWTGDNYSTWEYLYYSITGILSMQLFGLPQTGADICGFNGNTTAELCSRWMQLGAFYPFSRNHNIEGAIPQEPWAFGPDHLAISYEALRLRYFFIPYFYTLFYEAHVNGSTVWRPMLFEYPTDTNTIEIDRQFMVGNGLLVAPQLNEGQTSVSVYFPADRWFDYYTGDPIGSTSVGQWINVPSPMQTVCSFPIFLFACQSIN
jgi:alpha-glucosidase (family GH31 glycosyl hydrolase)